MRLIDADALIEATDGISQDPTCPMHIAAEYYQYMTEAPTIEAEPVRHGRWTRVGGDLHSSGYAVSCSNCGKHHFVHYRGSLGGLYGHEELFSEPPNCPNCRAKMDGDSHD